MPILIHKAFQFRLRPTADQAEQLARFAGCTRFVWNKVLAMNLERLRRREPLLWYQEANFWLNRWKCSEEMGFLAECPAQVLQQKLKDLDKAFRDAFDKRKPDKRLPRFKKRGVDDRFRYPQHIKIDEIVDQVFLPKIGWVNYCNSRKIEGQIKGATVTRQAGRWYVSILVAVELDLPVPKTAVTGLDLGVVKLATLPDGTSFDAVEALHRYEDKLAWEQHKLARKKKFSRNWLKQKLKAARLHERIANIRRDYLHKVSTDLAKNHGLIVVEDLKVRNMTRSAKGTMDEPGHNVKAKSGLNQSILSQGWGMFVAMLQYKLAWRGGMLVKVDPRDTSRHCPRCGHTDKANRPDQPTFRCVECGFTAHADRVGAFNILSRGMEKLRDEGRDTADASAGWLREKLSSHSPDRLFAEVFGEPGLAPV